MKLSECVLDLIFPPKCVFCRKILDRGEHPICPECPGTKYRIPAGKAGHGDFYSLCVSPLRYSGDVRKSLLRYKFGDMSIYADIYGEILAERISAELDGRWDIISWIPLSDRRMRERGYDQAELLAEAAAKRLGVHAQRTLVKIRHTGRQSDTGPEAKRRANVSGAYSAYDPELVKDRRILLIDDIITTGATLSECARTLLLAGAKEIVGAALASAETE